MENGKKTINTFKDLHVYQNLYKAMLLVLTKIIPRLPKEEKYDLADQMRRGCKAGPSTRRRICQKISKEKLGEIYK